MKTLRFLWTAIIAVCLGVCFTACSDDDDDNGLNGNGKSNNGGTIKTENSVTLETAGTLSLVLGDKVQTITSLKIKGPLNGDDIICLRQMLRCTDEDADKRGMLTVLDLSDANIVSGGDKYYNGSYSTSSGKIGNYMFCYCESLEQMALPESVTTIGEFSFAGCKGLTEITIPSSVTEIGRNTFGGCSGLQRVTLPNSLTIIERELFYNCTSLYSISIPNSVTSIGYNAFDHCTGLTSVTIPNSVISIGNDAFYHCSSLAQVTIPNSVTTIGSGAFASCTGLTRFDVAEDNEYYCAVDGVLYSKDMTTLEQFPLASPLLPSFDIPNSVTTIGSYAFYNCTSLTKVTIPNSVTRMGSQVFDYCSGLESITSLNSEPPGCGDYTFCHSVPTSTCVLYVPLGAKEAYSKATGWKSFSNIVEMN